MQIMTVSRWEKRAYTVLMDEMNQRQLGNSGFGGSALGLGRVGL